MQRFSENALPEGESANFKTVGRPQNTGELVRMVVLGIHLILSGNAVAVLPDNSVGKGDMYGLGKQFCNFTKTTLGKTDGALLAAHCLEMNTKRDIVFIERSRMSAYPDIAKEYRNLPSLRIAKVTNQELLGETVYVQGFLENDSEEIRLERIYGTVISSQEGEGFLAIRPSEKDLKSAKTFRKKNQSFWKGISGSPIIRAKDDTIVGVMSQTPPDGSVMHFSWPDNLELLKRTFGL